MNNVQLLGNIGGDLELRKAGDTSVVDFGLATNRKVKGEQVTDWHNIVLWGKSAEIACQYLQKGSQIIVEGSIQYETYEKDGVTKYITKIHANRFHFTKKQESESNSLPKDVKEQADKLTSGDDLPF